MAHYSYIRPIDQPIGNFRLLDWLENNFCNDDFQNFYCLVAFAKVKPFYKLHKSIQLWNSKGKISEAIIGIDHKGTSFQALQYALENFNNVNILHLNHSTFHPKLYIFSGQYKASIYYGSSNFTSGGLETNFEGGIIIDFIFPEDQVEYDNLFKCYTTLPASCITKLTLTILDLLNKHGLLLDETKKVNFSSTSSSLNFTKSSLPLFDGIAIKPARPIPKDIMPTVAIDSGIISSSTKNKKSNKKSSTSIATPIITNGLIIQIVPHSNGEIHLSKIAVNQNPIFFGYPFTGTTIPKKTNNTTYPQRDPDPIVNIYVHDNTGTLVNTESNYALNTIYYDKRSEIRITITPSILSDLKFDTTTNDYPILVITNSTIINCDYELNFYAFGSSIYNDYLSMCNQSLPSGGKAIPRKMGWF